MCDWRALSLAAVERGGLHACQSALWRLHCLRNNNSKRHLNTETRLERQSLSYANFSLIKFLLTTRNTFMGMCVCVSCRHLCVMSAHAHKWSITVYRCYWRMIALICHSFFPSDRHSVLICIQHLRLRMFNAAIKLISDIKCICD